MREAIEACLGDGGRFDELAFRRSLAGVREHREVVVPDAAGLPRGARLGA